MKPTLCSRCKKNLAVVFITKIDGGKTVNEGLCLKCAKEMGIKPVDDMIERMGLSEDDLENLNGEMTEAMNGLESLLSQGHDAEDVSEDDESDSQTATFPFLNKLFGAAGQGQDNTPAVPEPEKTESRQRSGDKPNPKNKKHKFLDTYCQNLTQKARDGKLDRIIGREEETERVIQILNRRQKNNPCLIGEPGVGKTAIAEGLAQKIADKDVPYKLQNKEVYLMDLTALVAGTQFRGQFESRMKGLIEEVKKLGNIILVIDEVHNLVGAGDAEGSMNAANILKPALSRGEIQVIGATTFNEYRKHIEKDAALERRFQPVTVAEPTIEQSIAIIRGISHYYETFHGVVISPEIARQAVLLSERYITDRFLPDKAIDLIDEACSDVNLKNKNIGRLEALKKEHADYDLELSMLTENAEKTQDDYARMAELRSRNLQLDSEITELEKLPKPALTIDNLARIIELWTKIPASKIRAQEYEQLLNLDAELKKHIVGQDEAIASVVSAIRRSRVGIQVKKHPVSFIFVAAVTTAMRIAAVAQAVLNAVMAANPIMLVITLIAALTAVLTYFFTCTNTGRAVWSSFTSFLGSCVQGITGFFSGLGSTIVGIFSSAANGARNAWNGVVGWFRGLPGTIGGFFSNAGSILVNAGASIINGFWDGLKGAWNNVTGWISGIGDWIKAHKGPISYDRRLLIPAGQAIMTGFAQGLNTGFDSNVETAIGRANRRLAAMPLNLSAQGNTATPAVINTWNVEINGEVIDKDGTAKAIKRLLADYDARRS